MVGLTAVINVSEKAIVLLVIVQVACNSLKPQQSVCLSVNIKLLSTQTHTQTCRQRLETQTDRKHTIVARFWSSWWAGLTTLSSAQHSNFHHKMPPSQATDQIHINLSSVSLSHTLGWSIVPLTNLTPTPPAPPLSTYTPLPPSTKTHSACKMQIKNKYGGRAT